MSETYAFSDRLPETDEEWASYWRVEFQAARTHKFKRFQKAGDRVFDRFLGEPNVPNGNPELEDDLGAIGTKLNIFNSNIIILMSMLFGKMPKVDASRRFADSEDDVARVAGLMVTRILNNDIEVAGEDMMSCFRNVFQDRLLPGLGTARVRYEFESEEKELDDYQTDEAGETLLDEETGEPLRAVEETISEEWTDIAHWNWKDVLWNTDARTHCEIRWKAYRNYFGKRQFKEEFPDYEDLKGIPFFSTGRQPRTGASSEDKPAAPQTEVWEIWDKTTRKVFWFNEDATKILRVKDDFLKLEGFFQEPPPLVANVTTRHYLPKSDYDIARDLYQAINELETRISMLTRACKLVGVYNKSEESIKRIFNEGVENDLIPVDNWAAFAEKGGLEGNITWLPIREVAEVIQILTMKQEQKIQQLQQVSGMSDVMRGAQMEARKSAAATKLEASFGSVRTEALQNEFARWVTDCQSIKLEIICKHYQPYTILRQSNILNTADAPFAEQAIALLKDYDSSRWRVIVRPESLAIADYAQLKADRSDFLMGFAQFMQSAAPLLELSPNALPTLMKLLKWFLAGFRGSAEAEGIIDQAISQFEKNPPKNDKPDPMLEKAKLEMQMVQQEHQAKMLQGQQAFEQKQAEANQKFQLAMAEMRAQIQMEREKHQMEMKALTQKLNADIQREIIQAKTSILEKESAAQIQIQSKKQTDG